MPQPRDLLTPPLALAPAGLALGSGLWLLASLLGGPPAALQDLAGQLSAPSPARASPRIVHAAGADPLLARPLFPASAATPATQPLRLEGVALSGGQQAALVQAGDKPAQWLRVGESVGAMTLQAIAPTTVTLEGMAGEQTLSLGHASSAEPSSALEVAPASPAPAPVPSSASRVRVSHDRWLEDAPRR